MRLKTPACATPMTFATGSAKSNGMQSAPGAAMTTPG